ncbi:uncharacterized protein [Littorina saxatilis]|uniref:uncharacterized protein n=1 Tax=Littorina saxatilis TaxID=31220 RepID=UPI0038B5C96F
MTSLATFSIQPLAALSKRLKKCVQHLVFSSIPYHSLICFHVCASAFICRRSFLGFPLNGPGQISRRNPYVVPNIFYGGSNVSLNIVNDIYEASQDIRTAQPPGPPAERDEMNPPRCDAAIHVVTGAAAIGASAQDGEEEEEEEEEEGDYAEIDSLDGDSNEGACGGADVYVSVDEIRKRKAELQKQMNASQSN